MANLIEYIYEEILFEDLKLNKLSNKLGKTILQIYNGISKLDDGEKYDDILSILKHMRVELLTIEKKFYNHDIPMERMKSYFSSYIRGLNKAKKQLSEIDDKKVQRSIEKIDDMIEKLRELKNKM